MTTSPALTGLLPYVGMPFGLCNASGTFQRCMVAIFHDMIEKTMEVFMDDFSVFGDSFSSCLSHLDKNAPKHSGIRYPISALKYWLASWMLSKDCSGGFVLQEFDVVIVIKKDAKKICRRPPFLGLKIPHQSELEKRKFRKHFPLEDTWVGYFVVMLIAPWFADFANYHAGIL
ncbi:hypothetical protein Tco_0624848 [Tanacetum coccineum]|uniref:Reverse transcriptase domain-containing protein n=1 Tax=Tanacetum coccineum TaxID=301880 RepID=A0ABQ4WF42_9ASTR